MYWTTISVVSPYLFGAALAFGAVLLLGLRQGRAAPDDGDIQLGTPGEVFILRRGKLVESNFSGRRQLEIVGGAGGNEARLRKLVASRFPCTDRLLDLAENESGLATASRDGQLQIVREIAGQDVRLEISSRQTGTPGTRDLYALNAAADELEMLRLNTAVAPFLLWRQDKSGAVTWANRAYVQAATESFGADRMAVWPLPSIFAALKDSSATAGHVKRLQALAPPGAEPAWYDCHIAEVGSDILCTAFRADEAVRSERRRHEFTQTLTKTFSDLSIGLAIFDRTRRLVLFNPSLTDLTVLPADFLSARPSMVAVLDRLRENRMMPEPKDYRAWRKSIAEMESAARDGTYCETWALPDGRTYRVSGRPHPDGALALLFEDISAEISLTRRFRAQIEQSHNVLDALDEGVAIFSRNGELAFANTAYKVMWDDHNAESVLGTTVVEATRLWHEKTAPTPAWGDFRQFVLHDRERSEWTAMVTQHDGRRLACRFVPQKGGATLALFRPIEPVRDMREDLRAAG